MTYFQIPQMKESAKMMLEEEGYMRILFKNSPRVVIKISQEAIDEIDRALLDHKRNANFSFDDYHISLVKKKRNIEADVKEKKAKNMKVQREKRNCIKKELDLNDYPEV